MEISRVVVKDGDTATVACPFCRKTKKISVVKYKNTGQRKLKIKCICERVFSIYLEFRRHFRKPAGLLVESVNLSNDREKENLVMKDISLSGIGLCPFKEHQVRKDDLLQVTFNLNDVGHTFIDADVTVRSTTDDYIGCEFNSTKNFMTPLGFFLAS
jgi:hypothetical protein